MTPAGWVLNSRSAACTEPCSHPHNVKFLKTQPSVPKQFRHKHILGINKSTDATEMLFCITNCLVKGHLTTDWNCFFEHHLQSRCSLGNRKQWMRSNGRSEIALQIREPIDWCIRYYSHIRSYCFQECNNSLVTSSAWIYLGHVVGVDVFKSLILFIYFFHCVGLYRDYPQLELHVDAYKTLAATTPWDYFKSVFFFIISILSMKLHWLTKSLFWFVWHENVINAPWLLSAMLFIKLRN